MFIGGLFQYVADVADCSDLTNAYVDIVHTKLGECAYIEDRDFYIQLTCDVSGPGNVRVKLGEDMQCVANMFDTVITYTTPGPSCV